MHGSSFRNQNDQSYGTNGFGFDDFLDVAAMGRFGGIVLLWNTALVIVSRLRQFEQELHALI